MVRPQKPKIDSREERERVRERERERMGAATRVLTKKREYGAHGG